MAFRGLFLASDVAQPEGAKILVRWVDTIMRLIERDAPANDQIMFEQHDETWELSRRYA